ncbi:molecular chaperone [Pantoea sp. LMR881]|nr:molecular chaperone [Pantoea sp. LMR881]MCZ4060515.1 molecular chaperone [Pantoea sp. LMR881]
MGLLISLSANYVSAGIIVGGTRVIYDGGKKEASLSISNPDSIPYLIQSWVETQKGDNEKTPFIITPPLYRLDQKQQNVMRIVLTGILPENKESMYWLNIKSIPATEKKENTLQVAVKTRIKLIYRPDALKVISLDDVAGKLTWQKSGDQILVTNPTSYYINFNEITVAGMKIAEPTYVSPGGEARFKLPTGITSGPVMYKIINDFGGISMAYQGSI